MKPEKLVILIIGEAVPPQSHTAPLSVDKPVHPKKQSAFVKDGDIVRDVFRRALVPVDGSMSLVSGKDGDLLGLNDEVYEHVDFNTNVQVVPTPPNDKVLVESLPVINPVDVDPPTVSDPFIPETPKNTFLTSSTVEKEKTDDTPAASD